MGKGRGRRRPSAGPGSPGQNPDRLLNLDEVADWLRLCPRTVQEHAKARRLPSIKLGRRLLFDRADVLRFIAANKHGGRT